MIFEALIFGEREAIENSIRLLNVMGETGAESLLLTPLVKCQVILDKMDDGGVSDHPCAAMLFHLGHDLQCWSPDIHEIKLASHAWNPTWDSILESWRKSYVELINMVMPRDYWVCAMLVENERFVKGTTLFMSLYRTWTSDHRLMPKRPNRNWDFFNFFEKEALSKVPF